MQLFESEFCIFLIVTTERKYVNNKSVVERCQMCDGIVEKYRCENHRSDEERSQKCVRITV